MTYKTKKILDRDFWDGVHEDIVFHNFYAVELDDITEQEFDIYIKVLNALDNKYKHFSSGGEEFMKYFDEFKSLLPEGKEVLCSWKDNKLVGFRQLN